MILVRTAQLLVLAAGVLLSLAIDWHPFSGDRLVFHWQYLPWAILTTASAVVVGLLVWRKGKRSSRRLD